jgi:myo-inositol-1(or 4)-monophosphatase
MPHAVPTGARDLAIEAARDAGALLRERLTQPRNVQFKGTVDLVTDSDRASEALIAQRIRDAFPEHRLIGEEGARGAGPGANTPDESTPSGDPSRYGWVVDPLDGTTNYAHGYPHFAVSIGLECDGTVILGVVYDPMRDELFVAERGGGATLNGAKIAVSGQDELLRSLLATGFPYDLTQRDESDAIWLALNRACQGVRRDGSAALNLCYVACGRVDAFWERPLQPWDMAAGAIIVEEAGGTVTNYRGGEWDPYQREVVASNGAMHPTMLAMIEEHASPQPATPFPRD